MNTNNQESPIVQKEEECEECGGLIVGNFTPGYCDNCAINLGFWKPVKGTVHMTEQKKDRLDKQAYQLYVVVCGGAQRLVVSGSKDKAISLSGLTPEGSTLCRWDGRKTFYWEDALFRPAQYMALEGGREHLVTADIFLSEDDISKLRCM